MDRVPPFLRHLYEADFRAADAAFRDGRVAATTKKREKYYANWSEYVRPLRMEPDLSNAEYTDQQRALSGFAARVKTGFYGNRGQVQAGTASGALTAVGQTIALDRGTNPTKLKGSEKFTPRLGQVIAGWRKKDSPVKKMLPVEVDVPEEMAKIGLFVLATALMCAVGDLALIAFYFLLRVGEYTVRYGGDLSKQTEQFQVRDARFFTKVAGMPRQLPPTASDEDLLSADGSTLRLRDQKSGWKNVCIHQEANRDSYFCGTRALARQVIYIRKHTSDHNTLLSAYWVEGEHRDISDKDI